MNTKLNSHGILVVGFLLLVGCSRSGKKVEDFTPPPDQARKSLAAALDLIQSGKTSGTVPATTPPVELVDTKWKAGQKLKSYEILDEDTPEGTAARYFKVRLTLASGQTLDVKYVVVGIDPMWVYREEDFQALSGAGK